MDVADDVERPVLVFEIVPQRLRSIDACLDFLRRLEDVDVAETFALQSSQRPTQLLRLLPNTCGPNSRSGRRAVPIVAELSGRLNTIATGSSDIAARTPRAASGPRAERSSHRPQSIARGQSLAGDEVQHFESVARSGLVVLIVG